MMWMESQHAIFPRRSCQPEVQCNLEASVSQKTAGIFVRRFILLTPDVMHHAVIGCLVAVYINDFFGRRLSLVITGGISIIGVLVEVTSATGGGAARFDQFVVGKTIVSVAMGLAANIVPIYLSETSTGAARGFAVSLYQNVQILGLILASGVVYASAKSTSSLAYLLPIGLQLIAPTIMVVACIFLPESPRWLVWKK